MSTPTADSLRQQLADDREKGQSDRLAELIGTVRCGRIDDHEPHHWTRPHLIGARGPVRYWCKGPGVVEGGAR